VNQTGAVVLAVFLSVLLCVAGMLALIWAGWLPAQTAWCPNGRIVYSQSGHDYDVPKLCEAVSK
jgi:hypothetical protein